VDERRRRFDAEVLPHLDAAYRFARWLTRSPSDADDVTQEALLRAFRGFGTLRGSDVKAWLLAIVRNCHASAYAQAQRRAFAVFVEALEAGIAAVRPGVRAGDVAKAENDVFRKYGLGEYTTSQWTRVRGHGMGLFADSKPHILEDVDTVLEPGMTLIVHPNTYHPDAGYIVLGDAIVVTEDGAEVLCKTPRQLFEVAA